MTIALTYLIAAMTTSTGGADAAASDAGSAAPEAGEGGAEGDAAAAAAGAETRATQEPRERVILTTTAIARGNPLGLDVQAKLAFKSRIGDSDELLFKSRYWSASATGGINPANWTGGVAAEIEPIAFFQLRAQYEARGFFGTFGAIVSGADGTLGISDAELVDADKRDAESPAVGHIFTLQPTLQVKLGPIAAQNIFQAAYGVWTVRDGDTVVYDPGPDMLVPANGVTLTDTTLVVFLGETFLAGGLYQYAAPLGVDGGNDVHRIGALGAYTFYDRGAREGFFNKATVTLVSLFNVQHRGRAGLVPTVVAVLSAESDLL